MIVVIIIGILASIAAPMMANMKVRAICSEAVTGMGAIRTAMQAYYLENNKYPNPGFIGNARLTEDQFRANLPGLMQKQDLTGAYFGMQCYMVIPATIYCYMDPRRAGQPASSAPLSAEAAKCADNPAQRAFLYMSVSDGKIQQSSVSRSGY